jgi:putative CocE/NonD family hydrolase
MAGDQSFASERSDVISFTGRTLSDTLAVAGPLKVHISFSSTGTDADIVVKLIDVRPDGYQMMVRGDVMPARYRDGFEKAEALKPGKRYSVTFTLNDVYHYFLPGHRLMVQVQSSWFPLVAMNPQTFVENQCKALANDYASACITLYFEKNANSYIEIPVL